MLNKSPMMIANLCSGRLTHPLQVIDVNGVNNPMELISNFMMSQRRIVLHPKKMEIFMIDTFFKNWSLVYHLKRFEEKACGLPYHL